MGSNGLQQETSGDATTEIEFATGSASGSATGSCTGSRSTMDVSVFVKGLGEASSFFAKGIGQVGGAAFYFAQNFDGFDGGSATRPPSRQKRSESLVQAARAQVER